MRVLLLIAGMFLIGSCTQSMEESKAVQVPFYQSHQGNWQGALKIYKSDSMVRELNMTFNLESLKDSMQYKRFKWQIQYEGQELRDYLLLLDTIAKTYQIDEQNGIVLPARLNNQNLSNWFTVMGNTLFVNFDFSSLDEVEFTVNMRSKEPIGYTGQGNETIDSVTCYEVSNYQIGTLYRVTQ
jgi:hypothetical protein